MSKLSSKSAIRVQNKKSATTSTSILILSNAITHQEVQNEKSMLVSKIQNLPLVSKIQNQTLMYAVPSNLLCECRTTNLL